MGPNLVEDGNVSLNKVLRIKRSIDKKAVLVFELFWGKGLDIRLLSFEAGDQFTLYCLSLPLKDTDIVVRLAL